MNIGQTVKYSSPIDGEHDLRFTLLEHNGERVLIQLICNEPIRPVECVKASEVSVEEGA